MLKCRSSLGDALHCLVDLLTKIFFSLIRKLCGQPKIGDICGIKFFSKCREIFQRAEIIEYILVDKHNQPKTVNVRQIDDGDYKQLKVQNYNLYF